MDQQRDRQPERGAIPPPSRGSRPYNRPVLTRYGSVAKLTQGTGSTGADGPGNTKMNSMCL